MTTGEGSGHTSAKAGAAATTPSSKPRLLWRGAFHLPDGTALPGLAIVSTLQPAFARHGKPLDGERTKGEADAPASPFTLSKDQQDELSLSIEMVRHAPLRIVDVLDDVKTDERGMLGIAAAAASSSSAGQSGRTARASEPGRSSLDGSVLASIASTSNLNVTFESAGDVRLYVDPEQHATVAYFERLFAYSDAEKAIGSDQFRFARSVLILSFEKEPSFPSRDQADVFLDSSFAQRSTASVGDSAMEAVIIGISRLSSADKHDSLPFGALELHVGRRKMQRAAHSSGALHAATSSLSFAAMGSRTEARSSVERSLRPDDPAPRAVQKRLFSRMPSSSRPKSLVPSTRPGTARQSSEFIAPDPPRRQRSDSSDGKQARPSTQKRATNIDGAPQDRDLCANGTAGSQTWMAEASEREPPAHGSAEEGVGEPSRAIPTTPSKSLLKSKRRSGNHTPGHRGEKRSRPDPAADAVAAVAHFPSVTVKKEEGQDDARERDVPVAKGDDGAAKSKGARTKPTPAETQAVAHSSTIEEHNRSLVKKLVHYQLLGKGVERSEEAYSACFAPTCQGTLIALRKTVKIEPFDKQVAAAIVERHLEMYL